MRYVTAFIIAFLLIFIVGCGTQHKTTSKSSIATPTLVHQVGAYSIKPTEYKLFKSYGFTLDLTKQIVSPAPAGIYYLDARPSGWIADTIHKYHCKLIATSCPITDIEQNNILSKVKAELALNNPAVVGYYVQDDYAGNDLFLLEKIHQLAAAAGKSTVCGFGATLDFLNTKGVYERDNTSLQHFNNLELLNFSPAACDYVQLYIYSLGKRGQTSDSSMTSLMPVLLSDLKNHGWTTQPLIGSPQTWEGVPPTRAEVATQTRAFCQFGAVAIAAFTWHTLPITQPELVNSSDMRLGLQDGMKACQQIWVG